MISLQDADMRDIQGGLRAAGRLGQMVLLAAVACGCSDPAELRFNSAETYGKVYYLDGIGCLGFGREAMPEGFRGAGFRGDVEYWSWSATGTFLDQVAGAVARSKGKELAGLIRLYQKTYPGRPVSLVGLSGGTGVAVYACENLPEGLYVQEVVLIASSLSKHYNLTGALRRVRGHITLYQTTGDLALGVGARIVGPIGGNPLESCAGLVGFHPPANLSPADKALYQRVVNVPYSPAFAALGFTGSHTSAVDSPAFVRGKIASLIVGQPAPGPLVAVGRPPGPRPAGRDAVDEPPPTTRPDGLRQDVGRPDRAEPIPQADLPPPKPPDAELIWWP